MGGLAVSGRKNPAAQALGRLGGRARSAVKAEAVRANGQLGGRPPVALLEKLASYRPDIDKRLFELARGTGQGARAARRQIADMACARGDDGTVLLTAKEWLAVAGWGRLD